MEPTIDQLRQRLEAAVCPTAPPGPLSVRALVDAFRAHAATCFPRGGHTSEADNFDDATADLVLIYGSLPAADFGPIQLQAVRQYLIERGLARTTINARIRRARHVFRWAVSMSWLEPEALSALETVNGLRRNRCAAKETSRVLPVNPAHFRATLAELRPQTGVMLRLQYLTAMRPGEVCAMRGAEIDRTRNDYWLYRPAHHKTSHRGIERVIPVGPHGIELIHTRLTPGFIFTTPQGNPYTIVSYYRAIARAARRAGVPHWSPNQIRHLRLTEADAWSDIETAQELASHTDKRTTEGYVNRASARALKFAKEHG